MIETRIEGDVHLIVLNRPARRNALTPEMLAALREAIEQAPRANAGSLLLAGEGPVFCGGFDLQLCANNPGTLASLLRGLFETIEALRLLPIPVVVAAHSAAIAGGCALLGGADVVVADRNAKLGYPVTPLGISPAVSAPFLRLALGDGACRARMLEPLLVSGADALRLGLVHELAEESEGVRGRAMEIATALAAKPRRAMAATRGWLGEIDASLATIDPEAGLETSLGLVGSDEERTRLAELFD